MKILFIGPVDKGQTSGMRMEVLRESGNAVVPLNSQEGWKRTPWISRHLEQAFTQGPTIAKLNSELLRLAAEYKPDLVWAEKQEYLFPKSLKALSQNNIKTLHFTPDPYFSLSWKQTRLTRACMPLYDYVLTSKKYELEAYRRVCKKVLYIPLGFAEAVHRPAFPEDAAIRETYQSDVAFIGGWEPRREEMLQAIVKETGCVLKIWGYGWDALVDGRPSLRRWLAMRRLAGNTNFTIKINGLLANAVQGGEIYADTYAWAISGARISIGFLRNVCPDQHTTRTFEIPACGSMLLADRSKEHKEFFIEGHEAEFFSSKEELIEKVNFYLKHEDLRKKIAANGYQKCHKAGYSYKKRLKDVLGQIGSFQ